MSWFGRTIMSWLGRLVELLIARIPVPRAEAVIVLGVSTWLLDHRMIREETWSLVTMATVGASVAGKQQHPSDPKPPTTGGV